MGRLLPGLSHALNYHPMFVHFPIVLWATALLFEFLAVVRGKDHLHRTAAWLLYLGTLAGIVALSTGWLAEGSVPEGPAGRVKDLHETLMVTTTSVAGALCLFAFFARKNFTPLFRKLMLIGLLVVAGLMTLGADRGADLVYQYGAGVDWSSAQHQGK